LGFLPALKAGAAEMVGPGAFTGLIFLLLFLFFLLRRRTDVGRIVLSFVFGNALGKVLVALGILDGVLGNSDRILGYFYLLTAAAAIVIGVLFLFDWGQSIFGGSERAGRFVFRLPVLIVPEQPSGQRRWWQFFSGTAICAGFILALAQSVWRSDEHLFQVMLQANMPGTEPHLALLFLLYVLCTQMLFFLAGAVLVFGLRNERRISILRRNLSKVQIVFAAFFLSYGISFFMVFGRTFWAVFFSGAR